MFTEASLHQYPELMDFIYASNTQDRNESGKRLKSSYRLDIERNQVAYLENPAIIQAYTPLRIVSEMGLLPHVDFLLNCMFYRLSSDENALLGAVKEGHLTVVERLLQVLAIKNRSSAHNNQALCQGALRGFEDVVKRLLQEVTVQANIAAKPSEFLLMAIMGRNIDVVNLMLDDDRICASFTPATCLTRALKNGDEAIIHRLLMFPHALSFADYYAEQYASYTHDFINHRLDSLKSRQNEGFDLEDATEASLCFYMLRNLIRRNSPALQADIKFLLSIPRVTALAHQAVTPGKPNELFCLALSEHNLKAEEQLSLIPDVTAHAEQHDFYGDEAARTRHNHRRMKFTASLACISILQAAYPAPRDTPRIFESVGSVRKYNQFYEILNSALLGHVFSYLIPPTQENSVKNNMRFVNRAQIMLFAQSSRASYRPTTEVEPEPNVESQALVLL
ncbi:MAG: hypothetical protein P1U36_05995 [Legionellaceae bacterium]|nr:hypothetical protein [Legionellaceae bacterium]